MNIEVGNAQHIGARSEQQDVFGFSDKDDACFVKHGGVLAVVADGIGGHAQGGQASRTAIASFLSHYMAKTPDVAIPEALLTAFRAANNAVCEEAKKAGILDHCGTTLVAVALHPDTSHLFWISAGDSRLYLMRGGELTQLTTDHNHTTQLLRKLAGGEISRDDPDWQWEPNALISFVGISEVEQEIDRNLTPFLLNHDDTLLLCSDGVYGVLSQEQLTLYLQQEPQDVCEQIVQNVLIQNLPNQDNLTAAVLRCRTPSPALSKPGWLRALQFPSLSVGGSLAGIAKRLGIKLGQ